MQNQKCQKNKSTIVHKTVFALLTIGGLGAATWLGAVFDPGVANGNGKLGSLRTTPDIHQERYFFFNALTSVS